MNKNRTIFLLQIGLICCIAILGSSCGNMQNTPLFYDTHAIEQLQQKVNFPVIVPTYFPEGIKHIPSYVPEPSKGGLQDGSVEITINYDQPGNNKKLITISELNEEVISQPSSGTSVLVDISGISVLEEDINPNQVSNTPNGYRYYWNKNGLHFSVYIWLR